MPWVGTSCQDVRPEHQVAIYDIAPSAVHPELCIRGDVRDLKALSAAASGRDAIIHLAAEHRDDPRSAALADEVNVGGARNVVAAARQAGCRRIVFTSSVAVYPLDAPEVAEDSRPQPCNRYGESKLAAERLFAEWAQNTPGASLTIVRACVVFGEGNRGNVYNLLRQIHRGRFVMVGNGRNRKSMAYVGNLTRFLATCLDFPNGVHLYNYADRPALTTGELVILARRELSRLRAKGEGQEARSGRAKAESGKQKAEIPNRPVAAPRESADPSELQTSNSKLQTPFRLPCWLGLACGCSSDFLSMLTGRQFAISATRIRKFCAETTVSTARLERTGFARPYPLEEALVRTIRYEFGQRPGTTGQPDNRTMGP